VHLYIVKYSVGVQMTLRKLVRTQHPDEDHCFTRNRLKAGLTSTKPALAKRLIAILGPLPLPMSCHLWGVRTAYSRDARMFLPSLTFMP
jgi:hypothetical protein